MKIKLETLKKISKVTNLFVGSLLILLAIVRFSSISLDILHGIWTFYWMYFYKLRIYKCFFFLQ
jgi:hypothetical protein